MNHTLLRKVCDDLGGVDDFHVGQLWHELAGRDPSPSFDLWLGAVSELLAHARDTAEGKTCVPRRPDAYLMVAGPILRDQHPEPVRIIHNFLTYDSSHRSYPHGVALLPPALDVIRRCQEEIEELRGDLESRVSAEELEDVKRARASLEREAYEWRSQLERLIDRILPAWDWTEDPALVDRAIEQLDRAQNNEAERPAFLPHAPDPWEYDRAERDAIEHEPVSVWTRVRNPEV